MTATIELNSARRKLQSALGESQSDYFAHMKRWFRKQTNKEDFDIEARKLLSSDKVHLHNEFLLAILNKCQTLANFTPAVQPKPSTAELLSPSKYETKVNSSETSRLRKGKVKKSNKSNRFDHRFQPVVISNVVVDVDLYDLHEDEKSLRYCHREFATLPDVSLIHGRTLVSAWEEGLEGVDDPAVELLVSAVQHQLRQIITAMITLRNGYKLRDKIPYAIGSVVPDPWLLNSQRRLRPRGADVDVAEATEDDLVPVGKPLISQSQQRAMLEVACGSLTTAADKAYTRRPISLFDLLEAMQKNKALIPSHTVYALNIERVIARLYHKGHND